MTNLIFALWISFMPIVQSISNLIGGTRAIFGVDIMINTQISLFAIAYIAYLTIKLMAVKDKKQLLISCALKMKKPLPIIVSFLVFFMVLSSLINGLNAYSFIYLGYFMIFICIYNLDKKQIKMFVKLTLVVVAYSCVLGFIDPENNFVPGFYEKCYHASLHYWNPNYAAYIVSVCIIITIMMLKNANKLKEYINYSLLFFIFALYLFFNGSFVPITGVFFVLFLLIVFCWIKEKKFQTKLALLFVALVPFNFIVDAIPDVNKYRTSDVHYFIECLAVSDSFLGTNFLNNLGIDKVNGADGWDRDDLMNDAMSALKPSGENNGVVRLLFGYGAGYYANIRPHNNYICLLLDYGLFTCICYVLVLIWFFIKFIRSNKNVYSITFASTCLLFIFISFFGSIVEFWYWLFASCLAIGYKMHNFTDNELENNKKILDDKKIK